MRGEYCRACGVDTDTYGSPPHAWGIRPFTVTILSSSAVHPHMRGEYVLPMGMSKLSIPVHPHMRGEYASNYQRGLECTRFTPTCVGNTK